MGIIDSLSIAWIRDWTSVIILLAIVCALSVLLIMLGRRLNDLSGAILGSLFFAIPIVCVYLYSYGEVPTLKELSVEYMKGKIDKNTLEKLIPYAIAQKKEEELRKEEKMREMTPQNKAEEKRKEEFDLIVSALG